MERNRTGWNLKKREKKRSRTVIINMNKYQNCRFFSRFRTNEVWKKKYCKKTWNDIDHSESPLFLCAFGSVFKWTAFWIYFSDREQNTAPICAKLSSQEAKNDIFCLDVWKSSSQDYVHLNACFSFNLYFYFHWNFFSKFQFFFDFT